MIKVSKSSKIIATVLSVLILMSSIVCYELTAFATNQDKVDEYKDKISQYEDKIDAAQDKIDSLKGDISKVKEYIQELDNQVAIDCQSIILRNINTRLRMKSFRSR